MDIFISKVFQKDILSELLSEKSRDNTININEIDLKNRLYYYFFLDFQTNY